MEKFFVKEYKNINSYVKVIDPSKIEIEKKNVCLKKIIVTSLILIIPVILIITYRFIDFNSLYDKQNYVRIENIHLLKEGDDRILKYHIVNFCEHNISFNKIEIKFLDGNNQIIRNKIVNKLFFLNGKEILEFQEVLGENYIKNVKNIDISITEGIQFH